MSDGPAAPQAPRLNIDLVAQISVVSAVASVFAILFNYAYFAVVGFRFIQFFSVGDFIMFAIENLPNAAAVSGLAILVGFLPILVDWLVRDILGAGGRRYDRVHAWTVRLGLGVSLAVAIWALAGDRMSDANASGDLTRLVYLFPVAGFVVSLLYRRGIRPFRNVAVYVASVLCMLAVFVYLMGADLARRALDPGRIFIDVIEFADRETLNGHVLRALSTGLLFQDEAGETLFVPNDGLRTLRLRVRAAPPASGGDLKPDGG